MHTNTDRFATTSKPKTGNTPKLASWLPSEFTKQGVLRTLVAAQLIAFLATYMIYFASMVLVEEKTHSSAQMGMMIFSSTLPGFLFALPAGAVVDRHNQVHLLVIGNVLRMAIALGFVAVTLWVNAPRLLLISIYATNLALSAIATVTMSAEGSLIPRIVKPERLLATNSIIQASLMGAQGAGIVVLAPALLMLGGAPLVGGVAALLGVLSACLCTRLPTSVGVSNPGTHKQTWGSLRVDLSTGWRFIASNASVGWAVGQLVLTSMLSLVLVTVFPGWVSRGWGLPVENTAYLAIPGGIGFGLGMWLVGRRGRWLTKEMWAGIGLLALCAGLTGLSTLPALRGFSVLVYVLASIGIGVGFALVAVSAKTVLQERSPDAMRGRIISTQLFLSSAASTLPLPLTGKLADVLGFQRVFALLAFIVLSMGIASVARAVVGSDTSRHPPRRQSSLS